MIIAADIAHAKKQKTLRKARKMKQSVLADLMGCKGQQECSDFENGKRHYSDATLQKLCEVLSVSNSEFKTLEHRTGISNPSQVKLSKKSRQGINSAGDAELTLVNLKKIVLEKEMLILDLKLELNRLKRIAPTKAKDSNASMPLYILA